MVTKADGVRRLVATCSAFEGAWQAHLDWWKGERAGEYNDLGALAGWVVDRISADNLDCLPALFDELEALLRGAGPELRDLLVVGFLEDIQNIATNRTIDPDVVLRLLGRDSRRAWFELINLWHGPEGSGWPGQKSEQ